MKKAVILVSGGLDSTTCLAIAKSQGYECYALSFDYGQRHAAELNAARRVATEMGCHAHKVVQMDVGQFGGSALTDQSIAVPSAASGLSSDAADASSEEAIPATYVPARNLLFLSVALGWAEVLAAEAIFIGVNAVDYSGYPDCRPEFISAFQKTADLATKKGVEAATNQQQSPIVVMTPLIALKKEEVIQRGNTLGVDYSLTVSCYQADASGAACGQCDSCYFRKMGFLKAGLEDPTRYLSD